MADDTSNIRSGKKASFDHQDQPMEVGISSTSDSAACRVSSRTTLGSSTTIITVKNTELTNLDMNSSSKMELSEKSGEQEAANKQLKQAAIDQPASRDERTHAYARRYLMLAIFCAHSAINSFQWIQYASITNVISLYYGASNLEVNLTSLIYMITYIPFIIQASLMLERVGLKKAVVLGTVGTALGSLIKWLLGGQPGLTSFWWMMAGQTIVALSQLYIISIPPLLASVWFPDHQVSTATGIGVFGNQLGIALGFIIPPKIIGELSDDLVRIGDDLNLLARSVFWVSLVICLLATFLFEDKPPKPPGAANLHATEQREVNSNEVETQAPGTSILTLCKDVDFLYLLLSYGINVGSFYAISTVLNQMVANKWPTQLDLTGNMGLLIVVSGMVGSVVCGQVLDQTHAYKLIIVLIYLFSLLSMVLFTIVLELFSQVWLLYLISVTLGFFMTGYLPLGFEFAAEITYPHPANTPAGLLNLLAQVS